MNRRAFLATAALLAGGGLYGLDEEERIDKLLENGSKNGIAWQVERKLSSVEQYVGYTKFNVISFNEALSVAKRIKTPFNNQEVAFIEELFYGNPNQYGFFGEKTVKGLTYSISDTQLEYIPKSGHFITKGESLAKYKEIRKVIGNDVILTSGVRLPIKQMTLFLRKMGKVEMDLRRTSESIAPPAYSYHSIGDFDIGKAGWGAMNFTEQFEQTDVFKKLSEGGYINIRYTTNNPFGVRFEPWHIKVVGNGVG
jgi:zinc D-Ala-D-Ala carboxypeptidase